MSYLNSVIRRTLPATRCQCAVLAVLTEQWSEVDAIWQRRPVFAENQTGRVAPVAYGTIVAILSGLVQQGFAEKRKARRVQYRRVA